MQTFPKGSNNVDKYDLQPQKHCIDNSSVFWHEDDPELGKAKLMKRTKLQ